MTPPLLETQSISHRFSGDILGLDNVSLTIHKGEFIVMAGANGSGKTLFMRHLNGLLAPSSGQVLFEGKPIKNNLVRVRQKVGLVFQESDAQIIGSTVYKDVAFGPENLKLSRKVIDERTSAALEITGLTGFDSRRPHTLSGGEKRRLTVAGVLTMQPELLVLDEPFTGLDWPGCARLIDILCHLHTDGTTIMVITHDLEKILYHAGRLVIMQKGRLIADDQPSELLDNLEKTGIRRPQCPLHKMTWKSLDG